ncbi:hypothetical protein [Mesorhizobium sp. CAU 1741]
MTDLRASATREALARRLARWQIAAENAHRLVQEGTWYRNA